MNTVFDGKKFAQQKERDLKKKFEQLSSRKKKLKLVDILVGDDRASRLYVSLKEQAARRVGINFEMISLTKGSSKKILLGLVSELNHNKEVAGIMFQLPLLGLSKLNQAEVINAIDPKKDVDCLTSKNLGQLMINHSLISPATVKAVWQVINRAGISEDTISWKKTVIVGWSNIVGKPLANFLINRGATVTVCHCQTRNLKAHTRSAAILISATGCPDLITDSMVSNGAIVIDVGSPKGDVSFNQVKNKVKFITPVPGGLGPVTIICLLENFVDLVKLWHY